MSLWHKGYFWLFALEKKKKSRWDKNSESQVEVSYHFNTSNLHWGGNIYMYRQCLPLCTKKRRNYKSEGAHHGEGMNRPNNLTCLPCFVWKHGPTPPNIFHCLWLKMAFKNRYVGHFKSYSVSWVSPTYTGGIHTIKCLSSFMESL